MRKFKFLLVIVALMFVAGFNKQIEANSGNNITITYYLDGEEQKTPIQSSVSVGTVVDVVVPDDVEGHFLFWTINGSLRTDLPATFGMRAKTTMDLKAYYVSSDKKAAVFVDSNLKLVEVQYLDNAAPTLPENNPGNTLSQGAGWGLINNYEERINTPLTPVGRRDIYVARYTINSTAKVNITVDGAKPVEYNANAYVTLESSKTNVVWKDEAGTIIGHGSPYVFSAIGDMIITSHEGEATDAFVTISSPHSITPNKTSYVGKFQLPENAGLVEYGFKYIDTSQNNIEITAVSNVMNSETNEFLMTFDPANKNNIKAYVVYHDGNQLVTLESDYRVHDNVGSFTGTTVPNWVKGYETNVEDSFKKAYKEAGLKGTPSTIQTVDLGKARVLLYQDIGAEGTLFLNDREGSVLTVTDPKGVSELKDLLSDRWTTEFTKSRLIDIVEKDGEIYYITDRLDHNGIFKVVNGTYRYETERIGVGANDYSDVTWIEYTKAYEQARIYMSSLGLPTTSVTRHRYTTSDLQVNGKYVMDGTNIKRSEKEYTKQQFENGWIIHARVRVLNTDGTLGGNQVVQHGAAPILNDMYNAVISINGNNELNITGAPVSIEFKVGNARLQNFEYGYIRLFNGIATFKKDAVVDSLGTEMTRRVGIGQSWNNWNTVENRTYGIMYERLRVGQNFRELVGQIIRDERAFKATTADPYADEKLFHRGSVAPSGYGVWFSANDSSGPGVGFANMFLYHGQWYNPAFELAPSFNIVDIVDNEEINGKRLGRPTSQFITIDGRHYQLFDNGLAFKWTDGNIHYRFEDTRAYLDLERNAHIKAEFIRVGAILPD